MWESLCSMVTESEHGPQFNDIFRKMNIICVKNVCERLYHGYRMQCWVNLFTVKYSQVHRCTHKNVDWLVAALKQKWCRTHPKRCYTFQYDALCVVQQQSRRSEMLQHSVRLPNFQIDAAWLRKTMFCNRTYVAAYRCVSDAFEHAKDPIVCVQLCTCENIAVHT